MVSDNDVKSYKQIKDDLDGLRLLVEKSELWVYKSKTTESQDKAKANNNNNISQEQEEDQQDGVNKKKVSFILFVPPTKQKFFCSFHSHDQTIN